MAPRRLEKFLRDFPNARKASDVREARARAHEKTLSEDVRQVLSRLDYYQSGNPFGNWTALAKHAGRIKDPDVLEAIRLGTIKVKDEIAKLSDLGINARTMRPTGPKKIDPFTKYPLLGGSITPGEEDHAVLYINAVYAANPTKGV